MQFGRVFAVMGAVGLFAALLMPWYGIRSSFDPDSDVVVLSAFEAFDAVDIALLAMAVLVAVLVPLVPVLGRRRSPSEHEAATAEVGIYAYSALLVIGAVAIALLLVKVAGRLPESDYVLRYGARFAVACAATMTFGAFLALAGSISATLDSLYAARAPRRSER